MIVYISRISRMIDSKNELRRAVADRTATAGVIGLGYVGFPLATETARSGFRTTGFDVSDAVAGAVSSDRSPVQDVPEEAVQGFVGDGLPAATTNMRRLEECDIVSNCVPTPLKINDPDHSFVVPAAYAVLPGLRPGQLVILESTTFPGTTRDVVPPILAESGLRVGEGFFLCFSPERVAPGNRTRQTRNTPKVIGGITPACLEVGLAAAGPIAA